MSARGAIGVAVGAVVVALAGCGSGLTLVECTGVTRGTIGGCEPRDTATVVYPDGRPGEYVACITVDGQPVPPKGRVRCAP